MSLAERLYRLLRGQVSLLLSEGHSFARHYPVATVWYEHQLVVERKNRHMGDNAALMYGALAAVKAPKEAAKQFNKALTGLQNGE